jgi:Fic family protein
VWPADPGACGGRKARRAGAYDVFIPDEIAGGDFALDGGAAEVLGNVEAMKRAIEIGAAGSPLTVADIEDIHRTLLRFTEDTEIAGVVRTTQNWIGGNDYNPVSAAYVPPPPEHVRPLLEDLCTFVNRIDLAPIVQAGIVHAQFETIHPFADGNGRVGRAFVYTVLRGRGEIANYIPPVSLILATEPKSYVGGLTGYRLGGVSGWLAQLAEATTRAAIQAERLADRIERRQSAWLDQLGRPRRDAAVRQLVSVLPQQPVIDVATAQRLTGKSHVAVGRALQQLEHTGVLNRLNERKWGRVWECDELFALVDSFEKNVRTRRQ